MVNPRQPNLRNAFFAAWTALILTASLSTRVAEAQEPIKPLPPDEKAFGLSQAEWQAAWVQWIISIPQSTNPETDKTGLRIGIGQHMPVWFLPPGWRAKPPTVVIPAGYYLFVSAGPGGVTFYPPGARTEAQLRDERQEQARFTRVTLLEMSIDGISISDLERYHSTSPIFPLVLPAGNLFGFPVKEGKDQRFVAVSDGYYLLLPPLPVGKHVIQGRFEGIDTYENIPFKEEWTYNLTVQHPNEPLP